MLEAPPQLKLKDIVSTLICYLRREDRTGLDVPDTRYTAVVEKFSTFETSIQAAFNVFVNSSAMIVPPTHQPEVMVVLYFLLFQMDEVGLIGIEKVLLSTSSQLAITLLNVLATDDFKNKLKEAWTHLYGEEFVRKLLMRSFERWQPALEKLSTTYAEHLKKSEAHPISTKRTVCKPLKLTQPRPRAIPIPEPIPNMEKIRPVPPTTYAQPEELNSLEEQKKRNQEKINELLQESELRQPSCARSSGSKKTLHESLDKSTYRFRAQPLKVVKDKPNVRLNTGTILREWKRYKKMEEMQERKLCDLEAGAFDCVDYKTWRAQQENKQLEDRLALAEKLRLSSLLSHEAAFHAKQELVQEKRTNASITDKETFKIHMEVKKKNETERVKASSVVKIVTHKRKGVKLASQKLFDEKKSTAKAIQNEKEQHHEMIAEQLKEDRRKKTALIKQIRLEEEAWLFEKENYPKPFDPTEPPGHGLLNEMSLSELKERLYILRQQNSNALVARMNDIKYQKQMKQEDIMEIQKRINCFKTVEATVKGVNKPKKRIEELYALRPELEKLAHALKDKRMKRIEILGRRAQGHEIKRMHSKR